MAQFDVYRLRDGGGLVLDCQSDLLEHLNTRFVAPLLPRHESPAPAQKLNPVFEIDNEEFVMVTQFAAAVQKRELGDLVVSFEGRGLEVTGAVDVLLGGV